MFVIFYVLFCMIAALAGVALGYWIRTKELEPLIETYKRYMEFYNLYSEEEKSE